MVDTPTRSTYIFPNTTEDNPGWLSPSQITEFLRCGYCYKLNRIDHLPRPLGINLAIGSSVHKAVEQMRLLVAEGQDSRTLHGYDDIAADHFEQEVSQPTDPETGESLDLLEIDLGSKYQTIGEAKDHAVALAAFAVPKMLALDAKRGKVAAVEFNLSMLDVSPYPFAIQGRLDALYVDWLDDHTKPENATIMADLKTAKSQAPPDEFTALAQSLYREFWSVRDKPLVVIADVVSKGKHPDLQSYPLSADDYGMQLVHQTVMEVAEDVSAGRFRPRPGWWCPYLHGWPEFQIAVNGFGDADGD